LKDAYIWAQPDEHRLTTSQDFRGADPTATTTLNTAHPRPWGWRVVTYLWAKGLGAGALFVAALAGILDTPMGAVGDVVAPVLAAVGAGFTGLLLVWDLKRPDRFYYLFTKPNHGSWLVLGGYCLLLFGLAAAAWFVAAVADVDGARAVLAWLVVPSCALAAGYTAFLFGQAEGRDLWQSRWLLPHLLAQALMVGAGAMAVAVWIAGQGAESRALVSRALVLGLVLHLAISWADLAGQHVSPRAMVAARTILRGRYARLFWLGAMLPAAAAAVLAALSWQGGVGWAAALAGLVVQPALLAYEAAFVRSGQDVPLS
jgi:Ni/Fe-hydrogenase subunit HybB-like protein